MSIKYACVNEGRTLVSELPAGEQAKLGDILQRIIATIPQNEYRRKTIEDDKGSGVNFHYLANGQGKVFACAATPEGVEGATLDAKLVKKTLQGKLEYYNNPKNDKVLSRVETLLDPVADPRWTTVTGVDGKGSVNDFALAMFSEAMTAAKTFHNEYHDDFHDLPFTTVYDAALLLAKLLTSETNHFALDAHIKVASSKVYGTKCHPSTMAKKTVAYVSSCAEKCEKMVESAKAATDGLKVVQELRVSIQKRHARGERAITAIIRDTCGVWLLPKVDCVKYVTRRVECLKEAAEAVRAWVEHGPKDLRELERKVAELGKSIPTQLEWPPSKRALDSWAQLSLMSHAEARKVGIFLDALSEFHKEVGALMWTGAHFDGMYGERHAQSMLDLNNFWTTMSREYSEENRSFTDFAVSARLAAEAEIGGYCDVVGSEVVLLRRRTEIWVDLATAYEDALSCNILDLKVKRENSHAECTKLAKVCHRMDLELQTKRLGDDDGVINDTEVVRHQTALTDRQKELSLKNSQLQSDTMRFLNLQCRFCSRFAITDISDELLQISVSCADVAVRQWEEFSYTGETLPHADNIRCVTRNGETSLVKMLSGRDIAAALHELRATAVLRRIPNIVKIRSLVLFSNEKSGMFGLEMAPHMGSLEGWLKEPRDDNTLVFAILSLIRTFRSIHDARVVHGDIKAENVLVSKNGDLVVSDFGSSSIGAATRTMRGTLKYLAPECKDGVTPPTMASDVFSVGTLVQTLAACASDTRKEWLNTFAKGLTGSDPEGRPSMAEAQALFDTMAGVEQCKRFAKLADERAELVDQKRSQEHLCAEVMAQRAELVTAQQKLDAEMKQRSKELTDQKRSQKALDAQTKQQTEAVASMQAELNEKARRLQATELRLQAMAAMVSVPPYWLNNDTTALHPTAFMVQPVIELIKNSCCGKCPHASATVVSVQRVESAPLWRLYSQRRAFFTELASKPITSTVRGLLLKGAIEPLGGPNEVWLWHGTSSAAVKSIMAQGLDPRVGRDEGRYGSGAYFADCVCKSLQYTKECLLLCRVILGKPQDLGKTHRPRIRRADLDPATNVPYDSVMGMGDGGHQEFIVYDGAQVYPEYVIEIK